MSERLQEILAQAGYGSRRTCEDFISAGGVRVKGKLAVLGQKADLPNGCPLCRDPEEGRIGTCHYERGT